MTADSLSEGPAGPKLRIRPQELEEKPSEFRWSKGGKCVHQKAHRPKPTKSVCPLDDSPRLAASSVHLYCSLRAALPVRVGFHALAFGSSSLSVSLIINFLSVWPKDMRGRPMTRDDGHHDVSSILGRRSLSILVIWPAHRRNRLSR